MKRFGQQLKKRSEHIRLSAAQRRDLRERIVTYMEYHPLPKSETRSRRARTEQIISEPFKVISIPFAHIRAVAGAFVLLLVVGIPLVAEHTLPGDVLYPVKIQFNEQLRSTLALSPYDKVQWETQRVERRLSEAQLLADQGKLSSDIETKVAQAVKEHTDAAQKGIDVLRESNSDEAAIVEINFASTLAVQSEVLQNQLEKEGTSSATSITGRSLAAIANVVANARESAEAAQKNDRVSVDMLLASIKQESTHAQELFNSIKQNASEEEVADIQRRLSDIQRKVDQAKALHGSTSTSQVLQTGTSTATTSDTTVATSTATSSTTTSTTTQATSTEAAVPDTTEATTSTSTSMSASSTKVAINTDAQSVALLRQALIDTHKLIRFMTDIDVRANVSIEELVPVSLTDDERVAHISTQLQRVYANQQTIHSNTVQADVQEKFDVGTTQLDRLVAQVQAASAAGKLDTAETLVEQAQALSDDLIKLIDAHGQEHTATDTPQEATDISSNTATATSEELQASSTDTTQ